MGAALSGLGRAPAKLAVTVALALSALLVAYKLLLCPKLTIFVESDLAELQKGELAEILDGAGLTPRSFFGQVVSPGDMRNEMYVIEL